MKICQRQNVIEPLPVVYATYTDRSVAVGLMYFLFCVRFCGFYYEAFHVESYRVPCYHVSRLMTNPTKWRAPNLIGVFAVRMEKAWVLSYPLSAQRRL